MFKVVFAGTGIGMLLLCLATSMAAQQQLPDGRLVKKDGTPLAPPDEKKEQDRIKKLVEQRSKQPRGQPGSRGGLIGMILTVAKVSNPRRTSLKGRASLAYDFAGDPAAHARNMEENALKKTAGTIWFDDADRQVARVEIHFFDNFRIAGGLLASVRKGTSIDVEQSPVGEGLWMQTSLEQHVGARLGLVNTRENEHIVNFDFKKFDVGMHQEIHRIKPDAPETLVELYN